MKIGILTFHRAINYGAVLQCYALYMTLSKMGHDVEIIDYRPDSIEKNRKYFNIKKYKSNIPLNKKIKIFVSDLTLLFSRNRTIHQFNDFLSQNFRMSNVVTQANDISPEYDFIFWGSDQIWNPKLCNGIDKVYWGQLDLSCTKKVTYAASIGRIEVLSENAIKLIGNYIKAFDRISVREKSLQEFIKEKYSIDTDLVCDPSLLLTEENYTHLIKKTCDSSFVLLYLLEENEEAEKMAKNIASQLNSRVIRLFGMKNPFKKVSKKYHSNISPSDFLSYIKYAQCVITNSFHAVSYSVIFNSDFYYVRRKSNNDRAFSLLNRVELTDRFITANAQTSFTKIDFKKPNHNKESFRLLSIQYIESVLTNAQ